MKVDVVVVGGGVNGLTAATVLGRQGLNVAVVEQNSMLGGLASGLEHGLPISMFAYAIGLVPREVIEFLEIRYDAVVHMPDPSWVELESDGSIGFRWWRSREELYREAEEAGIEGLKGLLDLVELFWKCYKEKGLYYTPTPPSQEAAAAELDNCSSEAASIVEEKASKILQNYLPYWAWSLVLYPSMYRSNAFSLAYYLQNRNIWDLPVGGMATFSSLLERAAEKSAVTILTGSRVSGLIFEDQRVTGVKLQDGRVLEARAVLYTPPIYTLPHIEGADRLSEWEIKMLRRLSNYRLDVVRVDYLLRRRPNPPREEGWRGYPIIVYWTSKGGGEYSYPGLYTPQLPPIVQAGGGIHDPLSPLPPGVDSEDDVILVMLRTRRDQEQCCGNITGHPDHFPMIDPYILNNRPIPGWGDYKTSIEGLYHGSASSYPGGEINLVAGINTSLRILLDLGYTDRASRIVKQLSRGGRFEHS